MLNVTLTALIHHRSPLAAYLIHHYINNIADMLQPTLHPNNPYRTIYVPKAIIGSGGLFVGDVSGTPDTPYCDVAMFYSLLATSSFHLRGLEGEETAKAGQHGHEISSLGLQEPEYRNGRSSR